jgi:hypothetical protein
VGARGFVGPATATVRMETARMTRPVRERTMPSCCDAQ